jgi:hypothetical protein
MNNESEPNSDDLMKRITDALETHPEVTMPADFAARVMARVPAQTRRITLPAISRARYGRYALALAMLLILAAMLVFAPATRSSALWLTLQAMLFAQLAALVLWFGWLRHRA